MGQRQRRALLLGPVLLGGACAPPERADTAAALVPSAYAPDLADVEASAPLTPAEVEESLVVLVDYLVRLDPLLHHEAWTRMVGTWGETETCPVLGEHNGQDYWNDDCTTSAGARFNGWALNFRRGGWVEDGLNVTQYNWLSGHAFIVAPDGTRLDSYGDDELLLATSDTHALYSGFVFGDFAFDDPAAAGTWLQMPASNETYFSYEDHGSWQSATIDAAIAYLDAPAVATRIEGFRIDDAAGSCAAEPEGRIRLRDAEGRWVDVTFGATGADDAACDGCGEATEEDGAPLGTVCADFSPFVSWEGWPWRD